MFCRFLLNACIVFVVCGTVLALERPHLPLHNDATNLLNHSFEIGHLLTEKQNRIADLRAEIVEEAVLLMNEEDEMIPLLQDMASAKEDWFWFLDPQKQAVVDQIQLKINAQQRVIETRFEDIVLHWRRMKPYIGLQSRMFIVEVLSSFLSLIGSITRMFWYLVEFGIIGFLIIGPFSLVLLYAGFLLGFAMIPKIMATFLMFYVVWRLPFIMIQYSPSFTEFWIVYSVFAAFSIGCVLLIQPFN